MTKHVATAQEEDELLPPGWSHGPVDDRYEIVWMIDDDTNLPSATGSYIVNTVESTYADLNVVIVDPDDKSTWTLVSVEDKWMPCPEE